MKKAITLPIRFLVIISIALIVMLAVVAFFTNIISIGGSTVNCQAELRSTCMDYTSSGCCEDGGSKCSSIESGYPPTDSDCSSIELQKACC